MAPHNYLRLKTARMVDDYDHTLVGDQFRLNWNDDHKEMSFLIEELPQKGKRRLGVTEVIIDLNDIEDWLFGSVEDYINVDSIKAGISKSLSYEVVCAKINQGILDGVAGLGAAIKNGTFLRMRDSEHAIKFEDFERNWPKYLRIVRKVEAVPSIQVMPGNVEPFYASGRNFSVLVTWDAFKAQAASSERSSRTTYIKAKDKGSARKLFLLLNSDPDALRTVTWEKFSSWLAANKVGYDYVSYDSEY